MRRHPLALGVVGAGAAGAMTATALAGRSLPPGSEIVLIDRRPDVGRGLAYSTRCASHVLNVPAGRLAAPGHAPDGFVRWLSDNVDPTSVAGDFAARHHYGSYLAAALDGAMIGGRDAVAVRRVRASVLRVDHDQTGIRLTLDSGRRLRVDLCVIASGHIAPNTAWAPAPLLESARFIADPWNPADMAVARTARSALLVGTGLTMVDVALALSETGMALTAISPSGALPATHRPTPSPPIPPPPGLDRCNTGRQLTLLLGEHLHRSLTASGDWRPAIDGLRPITNTLWRQLPDSDREGLLRTHRSWWNRHRHRMTPQVGTKIGGLRDSGRLRVRAATIAAARDSNGQVETTLRDGTTLQADVVINCTGTQADLRQTKDPLIRSLFHDGLARPGPLGLGLATNDHGRLISADHRAGAPLYTLGSLRTGDLWETTAIPEIRAQANELAALVATRCGATPHDSLTTTASG